MCLPGKSPGQRRLAGYSSRGLEESDMTWRLNSNNSIHVSPPSWTSLPPHPIPPYPPPHPSRSPQSTEVSFCAAQQVPMMILHMEACIYRSQSPNSSHPPLPSSCVHTPVFYICVSIPALQIPSSVPSLCCCCCC